MHELDGISLIMTLLLVDAEAAKEDSVVQGASALLRAQSLFRAVSRQPSALAGLMAALMAGSQYNSPQAQQSILECYLLFALRFIRPPQLALAQVQFCSLFRVQALGFRPTPMLGCFRVQ